MREFTLVAESAHACLKLSALVEGGTVAFVASFAFVSSVLSCTVLLGFLPAVFRAGLWQTHISEVLELELFSGIEYE